MEPRTAVADELRPLTDTAPARDGLRRHGRLSRLPALAAPPHGLRAHDVPWLCVLLREPVRPETERLLHRPDPDRPAREDLRQLEDVVLGALSKPEAGGGAVRVEHARARPVPDRRSAGRRRPVPFRSAGVGHLLGTEAKEEPARVRAGGHALPQPRDPAPARARRAPALFPRIEPPPRGVRERPG